MNKSYRKRVKPFNFLLASQARFDLRRSSGGGRKGSLNQLSPISAYDRNYEKALRHCFDRNTGTRILKRSLETYHELLNQYHLHPEAKFENGDYLDSGFTKRRHVIAVGIEHIGKEANRLEEQWFLGRTDDVQISYGFELSDVGNLIKKVRDAGLGCGLRQLARVSGVSSRHISRILKGQLKPSFAIMVKLHSGLRSLQQGTDYQVAFVAQLRLQIATYGLRKLAREAGLDPSNLAHMLNGKRQMSLNMRTKLEADVGFLTALSHE